MSRAIELKLVRMIPPRLPYDRSRTFDEATQLKSLSENSFRTFLRADWSFGPRVFGGYLIGIFLRAAHEHCAHRNGGQHVDPGSWTIHFLESPEVGEAEVRIEVLRSSHASTFLRIELWQQGRLCIEATVLQINLKSTQNRGLRLPSASMPELPFDSLRKAYGEIDETALKQGGWQTVDMKALGHQFYSDKPDIKFFFPPGTDLYNNEHIVHPTLGPSFPDQWWTLGKKCLITPMNLPIILDLFSILHVNYPQGANYFTTSESISCEMRQVCLIKAGNGSLVGHSLWSAVGASTSRI